MPSIPGHTLHGTSLPLSIDLLPNTLKIGIHPDDIDHTVDGIWILSIHATSILIHFVDF
jgi:hypothetical protein